MTQGSIVLRIIKGHLDLEKLLSILEVAILLNVKYLLRQTDRTNTLPGSSDSLDTKFGHQGVGLWGSRPELNILSSPGSSVQK